MIRKYGEMWLNYAPKYNPNSIIFLDLLSEKLNLHIQHALNGGEKKFVKYWIDGYIEKYNICIEWDEKHHNANRQKERDLKKEAFIIERFNCKFIRINEQDFLKNVETSISNICGLINNYIGMIGVLNA
jgi:very-short-patch-repair endonuclease